MRLVKIVDTSGQVLGYIPPFPDRVQADGTKANSFEIIVARQDSASQTIVEPVLVRLQVDRTGGEHVAYRVFEGVAVVAHLPGFQPRPSGAPSN